MASRSTAPRIQLSPSERETLEGLVRRRKTARGMAQRAAIILHAAKGESNLTIARTLSTSRATVGRWRMSSDTYLYELARHVVLRVRICG